MPIPLIITAAAAAAGAAGIGAGVKGAVKMKKANGTMKLAKEKHEENISNFEIKSKETTTSMDILGNKELDILNSFGLFSELFEKIHNKPEFEGYETENITLPKYNAEEIKKVSVGAGVLIGGISGAALGTAGGFAAAGATTAAVMAFGTASTGAAISGLSGVAATNATLAALGGGAIAAGGGGMALGTAVLGAATFGVGLLVGGIIFNITGSSLSNKADEAWSQMKRAEKEMDRICVYLKELKNVSDTYYKSLLSVEKIYLRHLNAMDAIININKKIDWNVYTEQERLVVENTVLLVQLLYKMCQVKLVLNSTAQDGLNKVNASTVNKTIETAENFLNTRNLNI